MFANGGVRLRCRGRFPAAGKPCTGIRFRCFFRAPRVEVAVRGASSAGCRSPSHTNSTLIPGVNELHRAAAAGAENKKNGCRFTVFD